MPLRTLEPEPKLERERGGLGPMVAPPILAEWTLYVDGFDLTVLHVEYGCP